MRKILFYLFILKKLFLLLIYPLFEKNGKLFNTIRKNIENYLVFQPSKLRAKRIQRELLKKFTPIRFINSDGIKLYAWFIKPTKDKPTILHLHGQAESILSHQDIASFCIENGFGLFLLSYRGHYKSAGKASEQGVYNDAQSAINQLKQLGVDKDKIIVWGHSLGSIIAIETASKNKVSGLILQSPIKEIKTAAIDVSNFYYKRLRLDFFARFADKHISKMEFLQKFDGINKISKVNCPILIMHAKTDKIAPYKNSVALAEETQNAELYLSDIGTHWDSFWALKKAFKFIENIDNLNLQKSEKLNKI